MSTSTSSNSDLAVTNSGAFRVFVYGTLQPGEENYDRYCRNGVVDSCAAYTLGHLYDLPLGYPALTPGDRPVYGTLLTFEDPAVLTMLDQLEEFDPSRPMQDNEYERRSQEIFGLDGTTLGDAWVYWMPLERALQFGGTFIPHGRWSALNR